MSRTTQQIENVDKLIAGLKTLPEAYNHFRMGSFITGLDHRKLASGVSVTESASDSEEADHCGSSACVIGHAPSFGIPIKDGHIFRSGLINWPTYADDSFGVDDSYHRNSGSDGNDWDFCFGAEWSNDIGQAIERLQMMQDGKIPEVWNFSDVYADGVNVNGK